MKLIVRNACKQIKGNLVLDNINLSFESGNIYGVVGRNGAGKTMLFRAISGLMKLDSGLISLDGKILHRDMEILPNVGIVLENAGLYPEFTGYKNLQILAEINKKVNSKEITDAICRVGLDPNDRRIYKKYSLGMKKRITIAQAIMEKPDVILLDEPTNGLDENGVDLIRNLIVEEKQRGALVLIASHNKEDISCLADKVVVIHEGAIDDNEGFV